MRRFGAVEPALAAYNGGLTQGSQAGGNDGPTGTDSPKKFPYPKTYNYVRRVIFLSEAYRLAYEEEWRKPQ